jgi:hypothetical protein
MRDILAWALATEIVGLAVLPLLRAYFANRRDAALLSRPVGLALTAYLGWALSLLWPFGFRRFTLMVALAALAAASLLMRRRSPPDSPARSGSRRSSSGRRRESSSSSGPSVPRSWAPRSSWTWPS